MADKFRCPYDKKCGGCYYKNVSNEYQLKQKMIREIKTLGSFCHVDEIIGNEDCLRYRNKMQMSYKNVHGNILFGNYEPSTHFLVPVKDCYLCDEEAVNICKTIKKSMIKYKIPAFDEYSFKGCIRHVLIRNTTLNEYMVVIVTGTKVIDHEEELLADITRRHPNVKTIIQNVNRERTSMILSSQFRTLTGDGYITDELLGLKFRISASSFYQINTYQTPKLYQTVIDFADLKQNEYVIDAYCGTGTIGLALSKKAKKVLGIELNEQAVKDAEYNRELNHIDNATFITSDAGKYMQDLAKNSVHVDTVIMDPPRQGADRKFLESLVTLSPKKIVYVSCNPDTLKNNLQYLTKNNYRVKKIQPLDLFPFCDHVETVVLLVKTHL